MPFGAAELARLIRNTQVDPAEVVHISAPGGIGYKLGGQLMYELSFGIEPLGTCDARRISSTNASRPGGYARTSRYGYDASHRLTAT